MFEKLAQGILVLCKLFVHFFYNAKRIIKGYGRQNRWHLNSEILQTPVSQVACSIIPCNRKIIPFAQLYPTIKLSIFEEIIVRNTAPSVGQAAPSLPSAKRQTVETTKKIQC